MDFISLIAPRGALRELKATGFHQSQSLWVLKNVVSMMLAAILFNAIVPSHSLMVIECVCGRLLSRTKRDGQRTVESGELQFGGQTTLWRRVPRQDFLCTVKASNVFNNHYYNFWGIRHIPIKLRQILHQKLLSGFRRIAITMVEALYSFIMEWHSVVTCAYVPEDWSWNTLVSPWYGLERYGTIESFGYNPNNGIRTLPIMANPLDVGVGVACGN